jgi:polysaccharide export outer membrane protein
MLKQRVKAQGLLPSQLETAVSDALKQEKLLVDPFVTVNVMEYHSRPVNVIGAVATPTTFQVVGVVTLLDAITRAGGLTEEAEGEILLSRMGPDKKTALTQRIPAKALIENGDSEYNIRLQGGEEIRVPVAPKVTIAGNVKKPGQIAIKESTELTVMKAIAMAEGLAPYAQNIAYIYRPDDAKGTKNEIPIPLKAILARKSPDVPLIARDILYIPDSSGKKSLEKILGVGASTISGLLIWRMP